MRLQVLQTNDFHGNLTPAKAAFIRQLKGDGLYFDCGDVIKAGNLAIPLKPDPAWALLNEAGCDASVLGNRETHVLTSAFEKKLEGHAHPVLCANLRAKKGDSPVGGTAVLQRGNVRVGVLGVMVPMVTERMATQAASAFLWDAPIPVALEVAARMRPEVDLLIALTHMGHRQDLLLAERGEDIDLILGGHSHTVVDAPVQVGRTWVCQAGSHGRHVGRYVWELGAGLVEAELIPLP